MSWDGGQQGDRGSEEALKISGGWSGSVRARGMRREEVSGSEDSETEV